MQIIWDFDIFQRTLVDGELSKEMHQRIQWMLQIFYAPSSSGFKWTFCRNLRVYCVG